MYMFQFYGCIQYVETWLFVLHLYSLHKIIDVAPIGFATY